MLNFIYKCHQFALISMAFVMLSKHWIALAESTNDEEDYNYYEILHQYATNGQKLVVPEEVKGIAVLSTIEMPGLGTYLSTWLPELLDNACEQQKELALCRRQCYWAGCKQNDGVPSKNGCCMDGFKWICCYKSPEMGPTKKREKLEVKCVNFNAIDRACNYPCWFSPWTSMNCLCRPDKKGMHNEYCATDCVSRKTPDKHCPWECCVRFFGLHCGCCDEALAMQCDQIEEINVKWPTSIQMYITPSPPVSEMLLSEKKCQMLVEKHCHCGWAKCHLRKGWGASLCCPDGYDLVCCTPDPIKIEMGADNMELIEIFMANFAQLSPQQPELRHLINKTNEFCEQTVRMYCPCGWAFCVERFARDFAASICCDMGFDVVCCVGMRWVDGTEVLMEKAVLSFCVRTSKSKKKMSTKGGQRANRVFFGLPGVALNTMNGEQERAWEWKYPVKINNYLEQN